ncbi:MAG: hypothetical protein JSW67_11870 [Candidatus Latescibacterota bacterium]|nr:MAG: hypothetical protein JSW67_11870 [Candidatus Latescibacterota bacterium]
MWRSAILAGFALLLLVSCDTNDPFVDVLVSNINEGNPLLADLIEIDDTKDPPEIFIPEDVVLVEFWNKPRHDAVITQPETFLHDFHVKRYSVTWRRVDGGPSSGAGWDISDHDFEAATSAIIPINTKTGVGILLAPAGMKTAEPFFSALMNFEEIQMIADIDFVGTRAITSDEEIHVLASLSVQFADFGDE